MAPRRDAERELRAKAAAVGRVLNSADGLALLEAVEGEFLKEPRRLIGANPQETAYRVGAYDVVVYLRQLQKFSMKEGTNVDPLA